MKGIVLFLFLSVVLSKSIDYDSLSSLIDDNDEEDEFSRPDFEIFLERYGNDYGYNNTINSIRSEDLRHVKGASYLDYTGAGMYRESQIQKCADLLVSDLYGNAHSVNPSSKRTESLIEKTRERVLRFFNTTSDDYVVVFTSGATQALHIVGEIFPWSKESEFYYLSENHNSVIGIREYAKKDGKGFKSVDEEALAESVSDITEDPITESGIKPFSLFAYPAEDNFAGVKYPLEWIEKVRKGFFNPNHHWMVLLDAAAFIPTNPLNLTEVRPDFVCMSFYKVFGYPTGLGALLIRKQIVPELGKQYWGGGTVVVASEQQDFKKLLNRASSRFEDGTLGFLNIACLNYGFDAIDDLGITAINRHVWTLTEYLYDQLSRLRHTNGKPVVEIYGKHSLHDRSKQGGIVSFNVLRANGQHVGYYEIQQSSAKRNIHLRTGCHCNPGACRKYLHQPVDVYQNVLKEKRSCADSIDSYRGIPLGGVRASLGYLTTYEDIMSLVDLIKEYIDYLIVCCVQ